MNNVSRVVVLVLLCMDSAGAASITSSTLKVGHAQKDGRCYLTETHTFDDASVVTVTYLGDATGAEERMTKRVPDLEAQQVAEAKAKADAIVQESATAKLDTYILTSLDLTIKTQAGLTDAELEALRVARGKEQ